MRKFNDHCSLVEENLRGSNAVKLKKFKNVLKTFGPQLRSLEASSIDGWLSEKPNDKPVLDCIKKYFCKGLDENVEKELKIKYFHFDNSMVENVSLLFGQLSKLTITTCKLLDGTDQLFANCWNLTNLKLDFVHTNPAVQFEFNGNRRKFDKIRTSDALDPLFNNHFPKLTSITMRSISTATGDDIDNFLSKNPQLKKLKIINHHEFYELLQSITNHVPNIEKLSIPMKYVKKKSDFVALKQLQKLELNFTGGNGKTVLYSALRQIARIHNSLEILKLVDFRSDNQLVRVLAEFETLQQLVLVVRDPVDQFQTLSEHLPQTEITVQYY